MYSKEGNSIDEIIVEIEMLINIKATLSEESVVERVKLRREWKYLKDSSRKI